MPDILIGNIRGPQGATGPANTLLASVYQFCASDSGATIPQEGLWTSGVPQIEKGKYIWCRNILTWDSGPETILYSVGYVGNDGDFSGIEIVNELGDRVSVLEDRVTPISKGGTESSTLAGAQAKLGITELQTAIEKLKAVATESANGMMSKEDKKRLDAINDETTGINLLRGTRDFTVGYKQFNGITNNYVDGFYINPTDWEIRNEDGYGILSNLRNTIILASGSCVSDAKQGDVFTVSVDVRFSKAPTSNGTILLAIYDKDSTGAIKSTDNVTIGSLGLDVSDFKVGEWKTIKRHYTVPATHASGSYIYVSVVSYNNDVSAISFRKLAMMRGSINNPIWSASPFDIDYINDETTGINLLRGTRDFTRGANLQASVFYKDGFYIQQTPTFDLDMDGFTVCTASGNQQGAFSSAACGIKKGDVLTIAFDLQLNNTEGLVGTSSFGKFTIRDSAWATQRQQADLNINQANLKPTDFVAGQWITYKTTIQVTGEVTESDIAIVGLQYLQAGNGITAKFKKLRLYKGHINHPVWSASPFDVASISVVNDKPLYLGLLNNTHEIPSASNLNNIITPGVYYSTQGNAPSHTNCPTTTSFRLEISSVNGFATNAFRQTIKDAVGRVFTRTTANTGTSWTDWAELFIYDTVRPIAGGGTGSGTLEGAVNNLWPQIKAKIQSEFNVTAK